MSAKPATGYEQLPRALVQGVDAACDRFEQAWQAGPAPVLEAYVTDLPEPARLVLLRELILVEVAYRHRHHETPRPEDYQQRFPTLEAAWLAKGPGTVARLAAALELLGWSGGPASRPPGPIGRDAVEAAVALWRDYFRPHATAAFNRAGPTDLERHARRVLRWLKAGNRTEVSGEEVRCGGLGRTVNAGQTAEALDRLEAAGVVRRVRSVAVRKGRPAERWEVNPAALLK